MVRLGLVGAFFSLMGLLLVQCSPGGSLTRPTPSTGVVGTATPVAKQTSPTPISTGKSQGVLSGSLRKFDEAQSYQFSISAVLKNTIEGRPREWIYKGSGAFAKPDKVRWSLEGQADVFFQVVSSGGKTFCTDSRGENTRDCSLAFGGPRPGSSPFTVISYLTSAAQNGTLGEKDIDGTTYDHVTFSPSLPKVASLDAAHSRALSTVSSVLGEAYIDKKSQLPFRENVVVKSSSPSGDEIVEVTLVFSKFNEQVDIKPPR